MYPRTTLSHNPPSLTPLACSASTSPSPQARFLAELRDLKDAPGFGASRKLAERCFDETVALWAKAGAAAGITGVKLSTANVHQESATLIHEIGTVASDAGGATYYVRWIKPSDAAPWQIAFDIMSIGE